MPATTDPTPDRPLFSVVIPAYGPTPHLPQLLAALVAQSPGPAEVVVVHSGPEDPTATLSSLIDTSPIPVRLIHDGDRLYSGAARNRGVEEVDTPWVAFLDCDVVPAPDYGAALNEAIRSTDATCLCGAVGMARTGGYWGQCLWFIEFGSVHPYMPARAMTTGPSVNMIVRREALLRAGGYPATMSAGEDAICQLRIRAQGGTLAFAPMVRIDHFMVGGLPAFRRHLVPLGAAAARIRKTYRLSGSTAAANPVLASGLWLARIGQIGLRVIRHGRGRRLLSCILAPGILLGLLIWNWGFLRYLLHGKAPDLDPEVDGRALETWRTRE